MRIKITAESAGPMFRGLDLLTNDPGRPVIKFVLTAVVKPPPDFLKRIDNAAAQTGEEQAGFNVWPVASPRVALERGERLSMFFRIRPDGPVSGQLALPPNEGDRGPYTMRRSGKDYWLELTVGPFDQAGSHSLPITLPIRDGKSAELALLVRMTVLSDELIVVPASLDLGQISISSARPGLTTVGRIGVRKRLGSVRVKSISSSLSFLMLEQQTMVPERNYVIRITLAPGAQLTPGETTGVVYIETDDATRPRVEVPIRIVLTR